MRNSKAPLRTDVLHVRPVRALCASALVSCLAISACSNQQADDASAETHGAKADSAKADSAPPTDSAQSDQAQRPFTNVKTTLSITLDGKQSTKPAEGRLQRDVDGSISFAGAATAPDEMFSLHLTIPGSDKPLRELNFELTPGFSQPNEIAVVRGTLPNTTSLRSVSGTAKFEQFTKDRFELTFDVELAATPRGDGDKVKANGTLAGFTGVFCLKADERMESGGEGKNVKSDPDTKECQELLKNLSDQ